MTKHGLVRLRKRTKSRKVIKKTKQKKNRNVFTIERICFVLFIKYDKINFIKVDKIKKKGLVRD